jgi:LemA protein
LDGSDLDRLGGLPVPDLDAWLVPVGFVAGVTVLLAFMAQHALSSLAERVAEAEANIEVVQQKRLRLVRELVEVASRFASHEQLIHLTVSSDMKASTESALGGYSQTVQTIALVTRLADAFPQLKADQTYLQLMRDLSGIENEVQSRYEVYNSRVRDYNTKRNQFPAFMVADIIGFRSARYLEPSPWYPTAEAIEATTQRQISRA